MASTFTTTLLDPQNPPGSPQRLEVQGALSGGGLDIRAKGFGTSKSETAFGTVARLEWFNGKLTLQVFVDSGGTKSTHSFDLQGVVETARRKAAVVLPMPASYYSVGDRVRVARRGGLWSDSAYDRFLGEVGIVSYISNESGCFSGHIAISNGKWPLFSTPPESLELVCRFKDIPPPPPPPPYVKPTWLEALWSFLTTPL